MKKVFNFTNSIISLVIILALILRLYRLPELLGFWYDQGRDALVIWDFIHNGKLFLIGPMMGFTGMFRGPWYYYLIAPFYYLGNGNPLWPSAFLIATTVFAILVLYDVGKKIGGVKTGLVAAFIASVSAYIIGASRWLSNPTPMLLIGISLVWAVFKFLEKKKWAVPLIAFLIGMGLNFGAATEVYYISAVLIIFYINRKILPSYKVFLLSGITFLLTFSPQMLFELRHRGVLTGALYNFIFQEKSFTLNFIEIIKSRMTIYYDIIASKFWVDGNTLFLPFFTIFVVTLILKWKEFWKDSKFKSLFILFIAPFLGTLFFVSNLGGFYDYYFTGYYLIFILFFSFVLLKSNKVIVILFLVVLTFKNYDTFQKTYSVSLEDPKIIAFRNQELAIDWIKKDAGSEKFNVDVYVPPVVPYAYEYLFLWKNLEQEENQTSLLYTLVEVDTDHPERINAWIERQKGIGKVLYDKRFGGITVEKRERI